MATTRRTVRLHADTYERVAREAARRDEEVDDAAERILRDHLPTGAQAADIRGALNRLEALRSKMKPGKGAAHLVREGREELEQRIA